jgi:DNA-binding NtrC family response regulator
MRREELVELAGEFFEQAKTATLSKSIRFPREEREELARAAYPWPGNIRELEKAIRTAVALHVGDRNLTAVEVLAQAKENPGLA